MSTENKGNYIEAQLLMLPEALSVSRIPKEKRPTLDDWVVFQGGMPKMVPKNDLVCDVVHDYVNRKDPSGTGVVVPTSIPIVETWQIPTVRRDINGRRVEFPAALVWAKHGKPCETESVRRGGTPYERIKVYDPNKK